MNLGVVPALTLSMWGGGVACDSGPEQSPPVVVVQATSKGQKVRICPKCHRRFFGEQRSCTVDGSVLMDFHEEATPTSKPRTLTGPGEASLASDPETQASASSGLKVSPDPAARTAPSGSATKALAPAEEPMPVRVASSPQKSWQPPPSTSKSVASKPKVKGAVATSSPTIQASKALASSSGSPGMAKQAPAATPFPGPKLAPTPTPTAKPPALAVTTPKPEPMAKAQPVTPPPSAVAALPPAQDPAEVLDALFADESAAAKLAAQGKLNAGQVSALASVGMDSESRYTSSQSLLVMQHKAAGNRSAYGQAVEALLKVPSNQYNPSIRLEEAEYHLSLGRWNKAIEAATTAERYRQKFPRGDTYYTRLARTYEVLAKGYEGRFTTSEDPDDLDLSIRMWQRYLTHVEKKADGARIKMAQENIAKLERIKERVL